MRKKPVFFLWHVKNFKKMSLLSTLTTRQPLEGFSL